MNLNYESFKGMSEKDQREFLVFFKERYGTTAITKYFDISTNTYYVLKKKLGIPKSETRGNFTGQVVPAGIGAPSEFMKQYRSQSLGEINAALNLLDKSSFSATTANSKESPNLKYDENVSEDENRFNNEDPISSASNGTTGVLQTPHFTPYTGGGTKIRPENKTTNLCISLSGEMSFNDLNLKLKSFFGVMDSFDANKKYQIEVTIKDVK